MITSIKNAAEWLKKQDNVGILTHKNPDGDTLGSAFALHYALKKAGIRSAVLNNDDLPKSFSFLYDNYDGGDFKAECYVAVDVADVSLLGERFESNSDKIELCIDHHPSNKRFAAKTVLYQCASATCEIMYSFIKMMGIKIDKQIANCLYTGIATDTGCFKYSNTTPKAHRIAAQFIELGADVAAINRLTFDTKTKGRLTLEQAFLSTIVYCFDGKCAIGVITQQMLSEAGAEINEVDGIASIPRQIEGVEVGITIKENEDKSYKVSMRTGTYINASEVCSKFEGGGHMRAAGFSSSKPLDQLIEDIKEALSEVI